MSFRLMQDVLAPKAEDFLAGSSDLAQPTQSSGDRAPFLFADTEPVRSVFLSHLLLVQFEIWSPSFFASLASDRDPSELAMSKVFPRR